MKQLDAALSEPQAVYLVYGDADLLVSRAVERIEQAVLPSCGLPAFNHDAFRGSDADPSRALQTARTLPMMADRRLVVLRELHEADDDFLGLALEYVKAPSPSTTFVLAGRGFPKVRKGGTNWSARFQNAVKKVGAVVKLASRDVDPVAFAREHAETRGKELTPGDARLLVELVGDDLGRLAAEIDKVSLYVGDAPRIEAEALQEACSLLAEQVVWDLTAGIAGRDPDRALRSLHRLLEEDDSSGQRRRLLGLVAWQLRQVLEVAEAIRAGGSDWQIRKEKRVRGDLLSMVRASLRRGPLDPAEIMGRLDAANRAMNSHRAGDRRILEELVVGLATG